MMKQCEKCTMDRINDAFAEFFKEESAGGILLLLCAAIAMVLANSPSFRIPSISSVHVASPLDQ